MTSSAGQEFIFAQNGRISMDLDGVSLQGISLTIACPEYLTSVTDELKNRGITEESELE